MSHSFPTIDEILAMHADLIAQFGGSPGLRDMGTLESAATRPQMGYYGSLFEEAAALMESLAMNHPSWTATSGWLFRHGCVPAAERSFHRL